MEKRIVPAAEQSVLALNGPIYTTNTKIKQKILEEEEYLTVLGKIVERDFYPELSRLKLRTMYIDALENNDLEALRTIQLELEKGTPAIGRKETPRSFDNSNDYVKDSEEKVESELHPNLTLDQFLMKNTSEDNASFEKIMEATRKKHREKHAWLYEKQLELEASQQASLALPNLSEDGVLAIESKPNNVDTWRYVPRNALMYTPDGVELSMAEYIEKKGKKDQEIRHENTRFNSDPFDSVASQSSLMKASQEHSNFQKAVGKIGVDGKLEQSSATPNVRGYNFVGTPSPAPGMDASPFMTWGELDGTPLRVDATPSGTAQGPTFKIPEPPRREQLAHSLAEKASKQHREKRKKAFAAATVSLFSPKHSPRTSDRLSRLSPAAQKLMKSSVRVNSDKSLRSSYTPSPIFHTSLTPTPKHKRTPGSRRTPGSNRSETSLTDNLLHIPKT